MSLVTLIQKLNSTDRDAVVQIEHWSVPQEAVYTGKSDEMGRPIYTLVKEAKMENLWHHKSNTTVNTANVVVSSSLSVNTESELKDLIAGVEHVSEELHTMESGVIANTAWNLT